MKHLLWVALIGAVVLTLIACTSQDEQLRKSRFAFRELNLPLQLKNDDLRLQNDQLEKRKNKTKIAVDTYLAEQGRAAVQVMNRFEEIWSYTIDHDTMKGLFGTGDGALMLKFTDAEKRFDDANQKCSDSSPETTTTLKEVEARCVSFREIYSAVIPEPVPAQQSFASAPGKSGGCASEIDELPYSATAESGSHKIARQNKDKAQVRCDEILLTMKQESAKCKKTSLRPPTKPTPIRLSGSHVFKRERGYQQSAMLGTQS